MSLRRPAVALDLVKDVSTRNAVHALVQTVTRLVDIVNDLLETDPKTGGLTVKAPVAIPLIDSPPTGTSTYGRPGQLVRAKRPGAQPLLYMKRDRPGTDTGWDPLQASPGSVTALDSGGTGSDLSAAGPGWLRQESGGSNVVSRELLAADIPNLSAIYLARAIPLATDAELISTYPAGPTYDGWLFRIARVPGVSAWRLVCCGQLDGSTWDWLTLVSGVS